MQRPSSMPINIDKPSSRSALLRGVKITEYKEHIINPDPIVLQDTDLLLEEFLSPTKLKALTGYEDLYKVDNLEMVVDTSETSLGNFGIYLPNLRQLKLSNSYLPRMRDLGTSLVHLRVLWLSRSSLYDLDGIPTLSNLEELYLAFNDINDISPCSMLDNLKVLDLEGNLIDDLRQVEYLSLCSNLKFLTLQGNPICQKPDPGAEEIEKYNYSKEVIRMLKNIDVLDDNEIERGNAAGSKSDYVRPENRPSASLKRDESNSQLTQCPFEDDWNLINQMIEEGMGPAEEKLPINECRRPGTTSSHGNSPMACLRPLSVMRPLSSCRPGSALKQRPGSSSRLASGGPMSPNSSLMAAHGLRPSSDPISELINDASQLTIGPAIQGNPLRGLLARKKKPKETQNYGHEKDLVVSKKAENNKNSSVKNSLTDSPIISEIDSWKKEHQRKLEERKKYFEPQVLRLDDDYMEAVPLTDDENSDDYEEEPSEVFKDTKNTIESQEEDLKKSSFSSSLGKQGEFSNSCSVASSRGDTGYTSVSEASLSSFAPLDSSLNRLSSGGSLSGHQPVIISAASVQSLTGKSSSKLSQLPRSGLSQLKSNIAPLSSIKFQKN